MSIQERLNGRNVKAYLNVLGFLVLVMIISGCKGVAYTTTYFSYPPNTKPHEDNWEYLCKIVVSSREPGPLTKQSEKTVRISVVDRQERILLEDKMEFNCAGIETSASWAAFPEIDIVLVESGDNLVSKYNDDRGKAEHRRDLFELKYLYDPKKKKFNRRK